MVYGLTKSEQVVKEWLITSQNVSESDIERTHKQTPDFKTESRGYEAKKLYKDKLIFYESQMENIKDDTIIVVTDLEEVIETFKWEEKDDCKFKIKIVENNSQNNKATLSVSKEFAEKLREEYDDERNDEERLKMWAEEYEGELVTRSDLEELVERKMKEARY